MRLPRRSLRGWTRRFASKDQRFGVAVTLGFAVTTIGVMILSLDPRGGNADGFLDSLFGGSSLFGQQSPAAMAGYASPTSRHVAHRAAVQRVRSLKVAGWHGTHRRPKADDGERDAVKIDHVGLSIAQSVCVRTCDGFAFPVGAYHGASDLAAHEATCHSECPGAATSLYVLPADADTIADAISVRTAQNYSKLPDAFHYTTVLNEACSCHAPAGGPIKSLLHDFTLRRGDAVMTARGFKVFHGGAHYPFRRQDFVALNQSRDIRSEARPTFKAIERASLTGKAPVTASYSAKPAAVSKAAPTDGGTKQLEHQASR